MPSDSIVTTLTYPDLPEDNVTLNISIVSEYVYMIARKNIKSLNVSLREIKFFKQQFSPFKKSKSVF